MAMPIMPSGHAKETPLDSSDLQAVKDAITGDDENKYIDSLYALQATLVSDDERTEDMTEHIRAPSRPLGVREVFVAEKRTRTVKLSLSGKVFFPFDSDPETRIEEDLVDDHEHLVEMIDPDMDNCEDIRFSVSVEQAVPDSDRVLDVVIAVELSCETLVDEAELATERDEARHPEEV